MITQSVRYLLTHSGPSWLVAVKEVDVHLDGFTAYSKPTQQQRDGGKNQITVTWKPQFLYLWHYSE